MNRVYMLREFSIQLVYVIAWEGKFLTKTLKIQVKSILNCQRALGITF